MKLEFDYRGHYITLLSCPMATGWTAKCKIERRVGGHNLIHTMSDTAKTIYPSLEDANRCARTLAKAWIDARTGGEH